MRTLERARAKKRVHLCELNEFGTRFYVRMSLHCTSADKLNTGFYQMKVDKDRRGRGGYTWCLEHQLFVRAINLMVTSSNEKWKEFSQWSITTVPTQGWDPLAWYNFCPVGLPLSVVCLVFCCSDQLLKILLFLFSFFLTQLDLLQLGHQILLFTNLTGSNI